MPRGGSEVGQLANAGLWGVAAANSDGTVIGTIGNRLWYGFLLIGIPLLLIVTVYLLFGHTTKAKESFTNKDVRKRPMFRS